MAASSERAFVNIFSSYEKEEFEHYDISESRLNVK